MKWQLSALGVAAILLLAVVYDVIPLNVGASLNVPQLNAAPLMSGGAMVVSLTDKETRKPIGRVDGGYVRVLLDGNDQGYLSDDGKLRIEDVQSDTYELTLIIPHYGEQRQIVEIKSSETIPVNVVVDMPNPVFDVSVDCSTYWRFDEIGQISVTLTNRGDAVSRNTNILLLVHRDDDLQRPIATHVLNFPSLVPRQNGGSSYTVNWECKAFVYGPREIITIIIFDGWPYTPQNEQIENHVVSSNSMMTELTHSLLSYLTANPDLTVDIISKIIVSWCG